MTDDGDSDHDQNAFQYRLGAHDDNLCLPAVQ